MQALTFLWIVDFDYPTRLHHGSALRHINYCRELVQQGHKVLMGVQFEPQYQEQSRKWFTELRERGVISDFCELSYAPPPQYLRLAALTPFPSIGNFIVKKFQLETTRQVEDFIARHNVDVVLMTERRFVFLAARLAATVPFIIDFCDCMALHYFREFRNLVRNRELGPAVRTFRLFLSYLGEDRYYARRRPVIVVSPVDQRVLRRIGGKHTHVVTLLNGVSQPSGQPGVEKVRNRLIFSGNMNFPPNCAAALWFLDDVFPLVLKEIPDAQFVIAGANPPPSLQQRASRNVLLTGYVEDLNKEIAQSALYVAPMRSGGGFKNKVMEAVVNRTYIVATSLAVEFLEPSIRKLFVVADSPEEMAKSIVSLLRDPATCESRLSDLNDLVSGAFTWPRRAQELSDIARSCIDDARSGHGAAS